MEQIAPRASDARLALREEGLQRAFAPCHEPLTKRMSHLLRFLEESEEDGTAAMNDER